MKQRPILFSAPMVRAILAGTKTQTRRAVKPRKDPDYGCHMTPGEIAGDEHKARLCPYGQPGDRLWVRETFSGPWCMEAQDGLAAAPPSKWWESSEIWYWADGEPACGDWTRPRPSIHMPRWASRITLEVTGVRVERLKDISEPDAIAEGAPWAACGSPQEGSHKAGFAQLWESINGQGSWEANPWVWVVEFKKLEKL